MNPEKPHRSFPSALQQPLRPQVELHAFDPPACGLADGEEGFGEVGLDGLDDLGGGGGPEAPLQVAPALWLGQFKLPRDPRLAVGLDPRSFL